MGDGESAAAVLIAVPTGAVEELERSGLAWSVPTVRGPLLDAVVTVGVDSAALVTLLQTPFTVRDFAVWISGWARRTGDSIQVTGRQGGKQIKLRVDGGVSPEVVADFLRDALAPELPESPEAPEA